MAKSLAAEIIRFLGFAAAVGSVVVLCLIGVVALIRWIDPRCPRWRITPIGIEELSRAGARVGLVQWECIDDVEVTRGGVVIHCGTQTGKESVLGIGGIDGEQAQSLREYWLAHRSAYATPVTFASQENECPAK